MIRGLLAGSVILASIAAVSAQSDPISERKEIMKKNGQAFRAVSDMQKGAAPFDPAKVQAVLKSTAVDYKKFATLFPDNSQTGGETRALPKIWTDKAGFDASMTKFIASVEAAQTAIKDEASLKTEVAKISGGCDSCHETYRAPRR